MAAVVAGLLGLALVACGTPSHPAGQELIVSVAVSIKDAVEAVGREFAASRPGVVVRYNVGASGALQKQIEAGAPIDVFVSAAARPMDELDRRHLIDGATRRTFARNLLVVVQPTGGAFVLARPGDLLDSRVHRVAVGNPQTVPAGQYAEESLRALGLWDRLVPRLVFAENVRQALEYVARGEVDAGIVYATDHRGRTDGLGQAFPLPEQTYRPITYPAAVLRDARQPDAARAFVERLASPDGQRVLAGFGFLPPAGPAR